MEEAKLLAKVAGKLHANYTKQNKATLRKWSELPQQEKRVWVSLARRAAGLFASSQYAQLLQSIRDAERREGSPAASSYGEAREE